MFDAICSKAAPRSGAAHPLKAIAALAAIAWQVTPSAQAQEGGIASHSGFTIAPRVSVMETVTNNVGLSSANPQAEQITDVSAGFRIASGSSRLSGYVDYTLHQLLYAQGTSGRSTQNQLNALGTFQAVENWAYLDFSGVISRQAISAFGAQSRDNDAVNSNFTESRTLRLSPYVRGHLGSLASYEARYGVTSTSSKSNLLSDSRQQDGSLQLSSTSSAASISWSINASRQLSEYASGGRATEADSLQGRVNYTATPQLRFFATGGTESNNYSSAGKESHSTSGWGADWSLSDRTKVAATQQRHAFGETHGLTLDHRTGRTSWTVSDTRSVTSNTGQGSASLGSNYDLLFAQYAAVEPDPQKRAQLVNAFLQVSGIDPNTVVVGGFLTNAISLQRSQNLSFALLGVRDTITFSASRTESRRLDTMSNVADDLGNANLVRQRGFSVSYSHRLTPEAALSVQLQQQVSSGTSGQQDTTLNALNINLSTRLGAKTSTSFGARRNLFDGSAGTAYNESALFGTLNMQF